MLYIRSSSSEKESGLGYAILVDLDGVELDG